MLNTQKILYYHQVLANYPKMGGWEGNKTTFKAKADS